MLKECKGLATKLVKLKVDPGQLAKSLTDKPGMNVTAFIP